MARIKSQVLTAVVMSAVLFAASAALAQTVTVDADPAQVANTFSPVRSLGAAIDRLRTGYFTGPVDRITFGSNEYQWHAEGAGGHADPDGPPSKSAVNGGAETLYQIPKASITVLRGKIGE